jgi:mono/diheme cytochrome c family protein
MTKMIKPTLLLLTLLVIITSACSSAPQTTPNPPTLQPPTAAPTKVVVIPGDFVAGKAVYEQYCQECHSTEQGITVEGPSFYSASNRLTLAYTKESIVEPRGNVIKSSETDKEDVTTMPEGFGEKLTEKELEDVIAFILSLK